MTSISGSHPEQDISTANAVPDVKTLYQEQARKLHDLALEYCADFASEFPSLQADIDIKQLLQALMPTPLPTCGKQQCGASNPLAQEYGISPSHKIYLDNGATTLKPEKIIQAIESVNKIMGNPERSTGTNSIQSLISQAKTDLTNYLDPQASAKNLSFTAGATDSINLVASVLTRYYRKQFAALEQENPDFDKQCYYILLPESNHHANILPWVKLCEDIPQIKILRTGLDDKGRINLQNLTMQASALGNRILLCALSVVVNSNGIRNNYYAVAQILKRYAPDCFILLDNAQASIYAQEVFPVSGCYDFLIGSLHKMYGPSGLGYLLTSDRIQALSKQTSQAQVQLQNLLAKFNIPSKNSSNSSTPPRDVCNPVAAAKVRESATPPEVLPNLPHALATSADALNYLKHANIYTDSLFSFNVDEFIQHHQLQTWVEQQMPYAQPFHPHHPCAGIHLEADRVGGGNVKHISWSQPLLLDPNCTDAAQLSQLCSLTNDYQIDYEFQDKNPFVISGTNNYNAIAMLPVLIAWLQGHHKLLHYHATHCLVHDFKEQLLALPGVVYCATMERATQVMAEGNYLMLLLPSEGHYLWLKVNDELAADDLATQLLLNQIVIRAGKHCSHLLHQRHHLDETIRFTASAFNTPAEINYVVAVIKQFLDQSLAQLDPATTQAILNTPSDTLGDLVSELYQF